MDARIQKISPVRGLTVDSLQLTFVPTSDTNHSGAFIWTSEDEVSLSTQHWRLSAVSTRSLCTDHHCMRCVA